MYQALGITSFTYGSNLCIYTKNKQDQIENYKEEIVFCRPFYQAYLIQLASHTTFIQGQKVQTKIPGINSYITAAAQSLFIPEIFAVGTEDGHIYIIDQRYPGKFIDQFELSAEKVTAVEFSPSHQDIVMGASADS